MAHSYSKCLMVGVGGVACALSINGCHEDSNRDQHRPLRVATWNIHGCVGGIKPVIDQLRALDADLVCLQEAEAGTQHADAADQAAQIANGLGMRHFAAGSTLPSGREQRVAILYRGDLEKPEVLDAATGRIYGVTAAIRWHGKSVRVVSVHLTSSYRIHLKHVLRTSQARRREASDLAERLRTWQVDVIVAGDFNSLPGMSAHDTIYQNLAGAPATQPTYPSDRPALLIDHIYHSAGLRSLSLTVVPSRASDHLPVLAELGVADRPE